MNFRTHVLCVSWIAVSIAAISSGGCLLAAAGVAGGAAAGYVYLQGKMCDAYSADFNQTWTAAHTALTELAMPIVSETHMPASGFIESRLADGDVVRISVDALASDNLNKGQLTRVCVRVATFGDHPASERLLNQISTHLTPGVKPNQALPGNMPLSESEPLRLVPTPANGVRSEEPPILQSRP